MGFSVLPGAVVINLKIGKGPLVSTLESASSKSKKKCLWGSPKGTKDEGSTGVLRIADGNVQRSMSTN